MNNSSHLRWASLAVTLALCTSAANTSAQSTATEFPPALRLVVRRAIDTQTMVPQGSQLSMEMLGAARISPMLSFEAVEVARDHSTDGLRVKLQCSPSRSCLPFYVLVHGAQIPPAKPRWEMAVAPRPAAVRAGDHGIFERTNTNMKITIPVVALGTGRIGDVVRVRTDSHQVWHARVLASGRFQALGE